MIIHECPNPECKSECWFSADDYVIVCTKCLYRSPTAPTYEGLIALHNRISPMNTFELKFAENIVRDLADGKVSPEILRSQAIQWVKAKSP